MATANLKQTSSAARLSGEISAEPDTQSKQTTTNYPD